MRVSRMHGRGRPVFSFEFFPPKDESGAESLMATVAELRQALHPDFVSVTYGAGGSTRDRTIDLVTRIQRELGITAMAHMTCVGATKDEIRVNLERLVANGIENVLALRGDAPRDSGGFEPMDGGFAHANELIAFVEAEFDVDIGAACYPETHPESLSPEDDLRWTLVKEQEGARFLITQLFFDNSDYFAFVERARDAGLRSPIVPGIMPITNVSQVERFTKMCGAKIPEALLDRLRPVQDDPAKVMATGIEHAILQCRELMSRGAPGLHFYTLNKSYATRSILAAVK